MPLPPSFAETLPLLPAWMARQRWYAGKGSKGSVPVLQRIGALRLEDPALEEPALRDPALRDPAGDVEVDIHLLLDRSGSTPTTYQVPLTSRATRLAGGDHALIATVGGRFIYDGPHDPAFAAALLRLMLAEHDEGVAQGHRLAAAGMTGPGRLLASRVLAGEQSNTSIILDLVDHLGAPAKPLICKLFRVLHHGENPDVVVQSALAAAGSTRVPRSVGYVSGQWPDAGAPDGVAAGHLAFAQEFLPGVQDAWRVALAAVASGVDFSEPARSLGQVTAQVHATLARAMGTRQASDDDVAALTRSMRTRQAAALAEVPDLAVYDSMISELIGSIESISRARWPALQRIHGDYHLGQVLDAPGRGWVLIDFEGEPLRPLVERTQPDLALRDVAGMLRSFDYVAGSWQQAHPAQPGKTPTTEVDTQAWASSARTAFLEGYASCAGRDPREDEVLLNALELDKALYEVVYEARNRPTWLSIPTTAIARIARTSVRARTARKTTTPVGPRSDPRS